MYETILFPTDGTDHSATVADHAVDIAETRNASLHVLSVVDDRAFLVLDDDRVEGVRADLEENAFEAADRAATHANGHGIETETAIQTGNPAECILEYADAHEIDLVVMGTSGDDYENNVVGSVSQRVVRSAAVPVLTIGPDA